MCEDEETYEDVLNVIAPYKDDKTKEDKDDDKNFDIKEINKDINNMLHTEKSVSTARLGKSVQQSMASPQASPG